MLPDYNTCYIYVRMNNLYLFQLYYPPLFSNIQVPSSRGDLYSENVKFVTFTLYVEGILFLLLLYLTQPDGKRTKLTLNTFLHR
jgi:hypothetical protein